MEYPAFFVALVYATLCIHAKPSSITGQRHDTDYEHTISRALGPSYGVLYNIYGNIMKSCVFPFIHEDVMYDNCAHTASHDRRWCATVENYRPDSQFGICTKVVQRNPDVSLPTAYSFNTTAAIAAAGDTCYSYNVLLDTHRFYDEILYIQLKSDIHCKLQCNTLSSCLGVMYDWNNKLCYIGMHGISNNTIIYIFLSSKSRFSRKTCNNTPITKPPTTRSSINTTYITKHSTTESISSTTNVTNSIISTTNVTKPSTTEYITSSISMTKQYNTVNFYVDKFIIKMHTTASGGKYVHNATTIELCKQLCLSLNTCDAEDFCVGLDFDETEKPYKCFLYNNQSEFTVTEHAINIYHYTKHKCLSKGLY